MHEIESRPNRLTPAEKEFLRQLARRAVDAAVSGQDPPDPRAVARTSGLNLTSRLTAKRGAFVTLSIQGRLRGCIGYIEGYLPLADAVVRNGRAAALEDPRFPPVQVEELSHLDLEISALTPLQPVPRAEDIVVGRHGILLEKQGRKAVFLPQVASEQGWDLETTLGHLALKAGLEPGDWHENTHFQVFEAEVF